ncbi:MAG: type II toxin-antitoxin system VapB family antitoxin [Sumerlaeia bacterium]
MPLTLTDPEANRLAQELAELTGLSPAEAVTEAMRRAVEEQKRLKKREGMAKELLAIGEECARYLDRGLTSVNMSDELFDEEGLPHKSLVHKLNKTL